MIRRALRLAAVAATVTLVTCTNPMLNTVEQVVQLYNTARFELNFPNGDGIAPTSTIQIVFSESMDPETMELDGNMVAEGTGVWSATNEPNDTFTFSPSSAWSDDAQKTLAMYVEDLQTYPSEEVNLAYWVLDGVVFVHAANGDDLNPGTRAMPKKTIGAAVATAEAAYDEAEIWVAEGTYQESETVLISKEMHLKGGYAADDWEVREDNPYWPVTGDRTSRHPTEIRLPGVGHSVTIMFAETNGTPTIDGFIIYGPSATSDSSAVTLYDTGAQITSCRILGALADSSIGVLAYVSSGSVALSYVHGGSQTYSTGIFAYQSANMVISDSIIRAGSGDQTSGIKLLESDPTIVRNRVFGGSAREFAIGMAVEDASHATIRNNVVEAGTGPSTAGLWVKESNAIIQNNTIHGGGASMIGESFSTGIHVHATANAVIENNIIVVTSGESRNGITVGDIASVPEVVDNNSFFDRGSGGNYWLYVDPDADSKHETAESLNADPGLNAADNFGDDPKLAWADDWGFTDDSPEEVTHGGKDLSAFFQTDINGVVRTIWSMGAYEYVD